MLEIPVNQAHLMYELRCIRDLSNPRDFIRDLFTIGHIAAFA